MERAISTRVTARSPELPASEIDGLLAPFFVGFSYRVYLAEREDSLIVAHQKGLQQDLATWEIELSTARPWLAAGAVPVRLSKVAKTLGMPQPPLGIKLLAIHGSTGLLGGLLLAERRTAASSRRAKAGTKAGSERGARLSMAKVLPIAQALLLGLRERGVAAELRGFTRAVDATLPYGFLGIDSLGRVRMLGGRAESILGVLEKDAVGKDCARLFRPVGMDKNPLLEGLKRTPRPLELYVTSADGTEVPLTLQMWRNPDLEGLPALVAFFADLSEERSLGEAERQKDRLAVLGELSAGVAHEIRNPLTGIANCAQVLREDLESDHGGQRFLQIILDEVARLNRIVEGLLGYARPNRPELREGEVEAIARRVLDLTGPELTEAGIRVELKARGRIPKIYFDPPQIEQVLLNLVRNAKDAMPEGGDLVIELAVIKRLPHRRRTPGRRATDRVRLVQDPPRQRFVQVRVRDTGGGVPEEILSRIWNPFFTTRTKGTGLGLPLSQSLVREHGGFLSLRSVPGKGTTVLLDLPVERRQGERRKSAV